MGGYAWVTLATNDAYSLGALVLAHSLRRVGTKHELACLVTPGVTATMREKLAAVFSLVQEVNVLDSKDEANLALLARPELGITFTKLHCWRLTQYEKCVFVDADTLVVRNCDELFEREELSAAPDVGWPDCFNSGVFVFRPSQQTFASITAFAAAKGSFDGGDQGLLNMYFSDWASKDISKHLPFIYNMCSTATYSYLPAFKQFGDDVRIIHFIGITKPWLQYFDTLTGTVQPPPGSTHLQPLLQLWWNIFCERVHSQLSSSMATSTLAPIWHAFAPPSYVSPFPEISDYSDATNSNSSRVPDFSEFKDPWEEYSPRDDPFPTDNSALNDKSENCYCGVKEADAVHQSDHSASQLAHNQQFYYEQQHSSYTPIQTYDQYQEHTTSHFDETRNQEHSVQHHWQQHSEHRHHDEQHQHEQWTDQTHHHVQHQHHEHRHNEQQHYNEPKQHNEHHQQFHQHDYYRNKADDHHQNQSAEVGHENHAQHYSSDNSHQNADHLSHTASHNEFHAQYTSNQDARDNFASHCYRCIEKNSEQASEAVNKQTDTRRIDFLPPSPEPCTDLHNVATRSDPNVTEHLDNANAGIAGALAQLTLGEARSAEQVAFEEHMRKQSWEQGQIDYMGRDSFDNIWKKICETLSLAPQREQTPPTEDIATLETVIKETAAKETAAKETAAKETAAKETVAKETTDASTNVKVDKPAVEADKDPTQSLICEVPKEEELLAAIPEQEVSTLSFEKTVEATAKIFDKPVQSKDVCAKPTTESKDAKLCEIRTEVPLPQLPAEPLPTRTTAEPCELPSSQTPQEAAPQSASLLLEAKEPEQQIDSQTSPLICKLPVQETTAPVTQISTESAPIEAKPETPASTPQDATQFIALTSIDSPQIAAISPVASQAPVEDTVKCVIESVPDVTQPLTIDPGEQHAEMLLAASEISTVSPVPIQVAESVLQAEPKESVLGAAVTVSDQAIASTVTAVHESKDIASAPIPTEPVQLNGSACEIEKRDISGLPEKTGASSEAIKEPASDLVARDLPSEAVPATEEKILISSSVEPLGTTSVEELMEQVAKIKVAEVKPPEQKLEMEVKPPELITKTKAVEEKSVQQVAKAETTEAIVKQAETVAQVEITKVSSIEQIEATEAATARSPSEVLASPIAEQNSPAEKPIEAKPPNVPSTPTVTEASPPISPSVESAQEMEEAAKKSLKKSDSADGDGEGADKKAKKTVKKVTKKPKAKPEEVAPSTATDGAAADGSQSKTKKTVKTTKKIGAKNLETDTSIPETPPPPTPTGAVGVDAPVPPKRKTKSTNAKGTTGKKPETEE
ncbi:PREDICTED: protein split ends isoform X1 [Trachymyrmex septentrionalis]|uniref:protein split ends isoform X1 n=1 Tax=Trachymyrmex septentrionalis TaxID=34720 RepID=UPI00084F6D23|nr:PREDICTED: protein split ends isoform X1 [Trachymyrmex septentrionalis]